MLFDFMTITLNGQSLTISDGINLRQLLEEQGLATRRVAVELNGEIIPKSEHANTALHEHDRLELVHALGGG